MLLGGGSFRPKDRGELGCPLGPKVLSLFVRAMRVVRPEQLFLLDENIDETILRVRESLHGQRSQIHLLSEYQL